MSLSAAASVHCDEKTSFHVADIIIVGAGISGTIAAAVLGRLNYDVLLVDRHERYPKDFRAEHLAGSQIAQLDRLGVLDDLTRGAARGDTVLGGRRGRQVDIGKNVNFGLRYDQMVNAARQMLPHKVNCIYGRVVDVVANETVQQVQLADGRVLQGKLLILAAGLGYALCRQLGISRRNLREGHSLTFGFELTTLTAPASANAFVVYQGEKLADKIDYLALFTIGERTRANLFTYRDYRDPWTAAFRAEPDRCLHAALPGLSKLIGEYRVGGKIDVRPMDLYVSEGHRRDGVILIGDAFQTSCPAAGVGITRALTDIERLCVHLPDWFRTPGMGQAKIAAFYDDPVKRACDAQAIHDAEYRRAVSTETGVRWRFHRQQVYIRRRVRALAAHTLGLARSVPARLWAPRSPADHPLGLGLIEARDPDHAL